MNRYWLSRPDWTSPVTYAFPLVQLGMGVDLSSPDTPQVRAGGPFAASISRTAFSSTVLDEWLTGPPATFSSRYLTASSDLEEASILSAYFRLRFGFASFAAALEKASQTRVTSRTDYLVIESTTSGDTLPQSAMVWRKPPTAEAVPNPDDRLLKFLLDHGSHYIFYLRYAFRVAVRGEVKTQVQSERDAFGAAFSAWGQSAGFSAEHRRRLIASNVDLSAEVTSGGIDPPERENLFVLRSFDEIDDLVTKIRSAEIRVRRAPVEAKLTNYWHTLLGEYPNCAAMLAPQDGPTASAPFGVPRGTILAWRPAPEDYVADPSADPAAGRLIVRPPEGWALCDGTAAGVPNLQNMFLRGAVDLSDLGHVGGSDEHTHGGKSSGAVDGGWIAYDDPETDDARKAVQDHRHVISPDSNVPRHFRTLFIVKL